jgi:hypothetical protein
MGPFLSQWVQPLLAKKVFATVAILDGALLTVQGCELLARLTGH